MNHRSLTSHADKEASFPKLKKLKRLGSEGRKRRLSIIFYYTDIIYNDAAHEIQILIQQSYSLVLIIKY